MYEAIVAVRNSTLDPVRRVIAEEYAYYTVPETQEASASIGYIANCTNVCERTVRAVTKELCDMGFLEKVGVNKKFGNIVYRVHYDTLPKREPYKYNLRGRPPKVYDGSAEKTPAPNAPLYSETPAPNAPVANKTPANGAYITEYTLKSKQEDSFFQKEGKLENPSSCPAPESVSPLSVSELVSELEPCNRVMSTGYVEPVAAPSLATLVAEILPVEPVKEKAKTKKAAKAVKPHKEPNAREAAFIAEIEKLDPYIAEDMRKRCGTYHASDPWSVSQVFLMTRVRILKPLWSDVTAINGESFDAALLLKVYKAWIAKHNDPHNLAWLLEWYKAGGPPQYKSQYGQQQQQQVTQPPTKPKIESDDPLVINFAQWIAAKPGYGSKSPYSIKLSAWLATNGDYDVAAQHIGDIEELHAEYQAAH